MVSEIERIRGLHEEQSTADNGKSIDRFLSQHYIRMHTVPLGQWMAMDFAGLAKLWNEEPTAKLIYMGRMGEVTFGADGVGAMSKPFIYDINNVADFAKIF
jgi:hypothetical protein